MAPRPLPPQAVDCHIQYDNYPDGSRRSAQNHGDLQRIEGVNCEGIRLTIGVAPLRVRPPG